MPKFSKDKQSLLKTLSRLDNGVTVSDVTDSDSEDSKCSTLVLHVFLEALCGLEERDEEKRRRLFNGVIGALTKSKLLNEQIALHNLMHIRRKMAYQLLKIVAEVHTAIDPKATSDLQYLDFMQIESSKTQEKYSDMFEEIKVIAEGGFGVVCMAKHNVDGLIYAVKKIVFKYRSDSDYLKVIREVRSIATLNHINIVSYNNAWIEEDESSISDSSSGSDVLSEWGQDSVHSTSRSSIVWNESKESNSSRRSEVIRSKFFQSSVTSNISQQTSRESNDSNATKVGDLSLANFMCPKVMLCIQMEYCDFDLRHWLDQRARGESLPFKMSETAIFRDILNGVAHIHSKSIIHRDLKPQNIFFSVKEGVMKIGDFGLATLGGGSSPTKQHQRGKMSTRLSSDLGTLPYAAPEQRSQHNYTTKVDIYSLGIILIELLLQFGTQMEFCRTIEDIARGNIPAELTSNWPQYVFLVENLVQKNPKERMSAKEILNLPLIQGKENKKKWDHRDKLIEKLTQKLEKQRSLIEEQTVIITQLRKQIEELGCS